MASILILAWFSLHKKDFTLQLAHAAVYTLLHGVHMAMWPTAILWTLVPELIQVGMGKGILICLTTTNSIKLHNKLGTHVAGQ